METVAGIPPGGYAPGDTSNATGTNRELQWLNSVAVDPIGIDGQLANTLYMFNDGQQLRLESNGYISQPYNLGWGYFVFDGSGNRYVTDRFRIYKATAQSPNSYQELPLA